MDFVVTQLSPQETQVMAIPPDGSVFASESLVVEDILVPEEMEESSSPVVGGTSVGDSVLPPPLPLQFTREFLLAQGGGDKKMAVKPNSSPRVLARHGNHGEDLGLYFMAGLNILKDISASIIDKYMGLFSVNSDIRFRYYRDKGIQLLHNRQYSVAARNLERALKESPEDRFTLGKLGICLFRAGRQEEGLRLMEEAAADTEVEIPGLEAQIGLAYFRLGDYQAAALRLERAVLAAPDQVEIHYRLGMAWDHLKEFTKAIEAFQAALKISPESVKILRALAFSLEQAGLRDDALLCFKRAADVDAMGLDA
ncbi:MAG: tetratricopeptide repeat protein, partial [Magnetococcus sp. DMHC-6]